MELQQLQSLITIISAVAGGLFVLLGIIITNRMGTLKEKIMDKVETKMNETTNKFDARFEQMKKEIHETVVTKDFFNGKFDLLDKKIDWYFSLKGKENNGEGK